METAADAEPLARAIANLPPEQRAAVALFYIEDLGVAENRRGDERSGGAP